MGDMAEFWNDIKEYRKEQKEKYDNKIHPIIENKLEELSKLGFSVVSLRRSKNTNKTRKNRLNKKT